MDILTVAAIEILLMLSITCIQTFFYYKTIGLSPKWRGLRLALVLLFVSVIEAALQLIGLNIVSLSWVSILVFVVIILYPVFYMDSNVKERIFFGIVSCVIFLFSALLGSIITFMFPEMLTTARPPWLTMLLFTVLIITLYTILVFVIIHLNTEGKRYLPRKYWTGMMISFTGISIGLIAINNLGAWIKDIERLHTFITIFSLGFLVIWLLLYFVFYFVCRYFAKATEANALAIQNDMVERYMLRKQASDERIQVLSHDLKHSLTQWRVLAKEKGDTNALQSISEYEGQLRSSLLINVENESANAIINQKCWEANQARVEFLTDGAFYKDLLISKLDLCWLLGNLLDNAVEAASQAESENLRRVKLSIRRKGNLLILAVENGYALEPIIENGVFATRKNDKDLHAIGMRSIRHVAEKYDGVVNTSYENKWFKATVMLCGYQSALSSKN